MPKIVSSDGVSHELTREECKLCNTLENFLEDVDEDEIEDCQFPVPFKDVYLSRVVKFIKYQADPRNDIVFNVTRDDIVKAPVYFELKVPKWYVDFFNTVDESIKGVEDDDKKFPIIHQIMNLSSFLEIDILTNMCGAKIASL